MTNHSRLKYLINTLLNAKISKNPKPQILISLILKQIELQYIVEVK